MRHEGSAHGKLLSRSQNTHVNQLGNAISLEVLKEAFCLHSGHKSFLGFFANHTVGAHLKVATFHFVLFAHSDGFNPLSFNQLTFPELSEFFVVFGEGLNFILLLHFNKSLLESTAAQDLQERLSFEAKIKQVSNAKVNCLVHTLNTGNELGVRWAVNEIVGLNLAVINLIGDV